MILNLKLSGLNKMTIFPNIYAKGKGGPIGWKLEAMLLNILTKPMAIQVIIVYVDKIM